jgi:hypothetical protein
MKLSKTMLRHHLERVTLGYLGLHDNPPEDLGEYDAAIRELRLAAEASGDLPWVKLGLDYLLTTPGVRLRDYGGGQYPYSEEALSELLRHAWAKLWPDETLSAPGDAAALELVEMPAAEWAALRGGTAV